MTYLSTVLADAPLHFWRLADAGGVLRYDIGSSPLHLLSANQAAASRGPDSDSGSEFFSNSAGASREPIAFNQVGTIELWFWVAQTPTTDPAYIVAWDALGGTGADIEVKHRTSGKVDLYMGSAVVSSPAALTTQTWHHIVGTNDGATCRLYLDGVQVATGAGGAASAASKRLAYGGNLAAALSVYGWMSELAYYTTVLTSLRVGAHYIAADRRTQPPVFRGGAYLDPTTGASLDLLAGGAANATLTDILNSVRRTYT